MYRMGENICKWDEQGLNFQSTHTVHITQYQKKQKTQSKMGRRPK